MTIRPADLSPDARARLGLPTPSRRKRAKRGAVVVSRETVEAVNSIRHRLCMIAAALSPRAEDVAMGIMAVKAELGKLEALQDKSYTQRG